MPAAYLHEVIADKVRKLLNIAYIQKHPHAYEAGAQGPDILFYYRQLSLLKGNAINNLGKLMHADRCIEFLVNLIRAAAGKDYAMSYCCGFLTHYGTDLVIHPYVTAMTQAKDRGRSEGIAHMQLEAEFETWIYRQQGFTGIPRQAATLKSLARNEQHLLGKLLSDSIAKTYPEQHADAGTLAESFDHMRHVVRFLHSPRGIKYAVIACIEKLAGSPGRVTCHMVPRRLPGYDYLNLKKNIWEHPYQKGCMLNAGMPELLDMAVEKSVLLIRQAAAYFAGESPIESFMDAAGNLNYAGASLDIGANPANA